MEEEKELRFLIPIAKGLAQTLGRDFEIVIHDLSKEDSIIAIENRQLSGRKVGDTAPQLLRDMLNSIKENEEMILNYVTKTASGKPLKSSTILLRNERAEIIGAFCLNIDLTKISIAQNFLKDLAGLEEERALRRKFPEDVQDFLEIVIKNSLELVDKPAHLLSKEERLKIVKYLDDNNAFSIKETVNTLARELNVSRYTIYNYLEEVRAAETWL
ncbi:MAG: helix-turn-helix transcriptional regulator [Halanaerobiales bacterium]|nr:helix-turn-helix transcriptional regulator [Halanaerobiales bacterium]